MSRSENTNDDQFNEFHDADLEAAFAELEQEFQNLDSAAETAADASAASVADSAASIAAEAADQQIDSSTSEEPQVNFEDELQGLLGNKAKQAVLVTRLTSASLLAAFCQLADIAADCVDATEGSVAILHNLDGDGPEAAAKDLTTVVSGLVAVLAVNRADKLEATMYFEGEAGQQYAPPLLFTTTPPFVEDLMLGITTLDELKSSGVHFHSSGDLTRDQALAIISAHTRYGRGGNSSIE
ncbi:hypothetical protein D2E26_0236 [Bifidobacterium dolichotidis]|uniref:Uncharacterized protein n=1 Tax=Bifidobacterium dolichotidis TaxID=2306976 RepID=A0A430FS39_9BIFI|nr:hypothetical protein [Bifidobacterium dolichotidis]RSX55673.1 hypothetical protein D2E26_0236 [Bifidobacterium dolichotidis]